MSAVLLPRGGPEAVCPVAPPVPPPRPPGEEFALLRECRLLWISGRGHARGPGHFSSSRHKLVGILLPLDGLFSVGPR